MMTDLLQSVEYVWAIWLLSCVALSLMVYRSLRVQHWKSLIGFLNDERGASYALAYLMTFPFYLMLVCWVIQSTMILIVKVGVQHAAHASVRSAVVWRSASLKGDADGLRIAKEKSLHAAAIAMVPYASGLKGHQYVYIGDPLYWNVKTLGKATAQSFAYETLYKELAKQTEAGKALAESEFVRRKYVYAAMMTRVELAKHTNQFNEKLMVTVKFRMPIHIPGTGRILGKLHLNGLGYYRDIVATATLPLETPEADSDSPDDQGLGINYDASLL